MITLKKARAILATLVLVLTASLSAFAQTQLGMNFSAEELAIWRQRANGTTAINYKTNAADGTPGDWDRIKAYADEYVANPTANLWKGSAVKGTNIPIYEGVKMEQAAFCYQIYKQSNLTLANQYAAAVRTGLLQQLTIPNTNIASFWDPATAGEDGFHESRWIKRLVVSADYIDDYLSASDKATLSAWFLQQANFMANQIQIRPPGQCFPRRLFDDYTVVGRDAKPLGEPYGIYIPGGYPDGNEYTHVNANGSLGNKISQLALHWNNRHADKVGMFGMVGIYLNNASLIFQAKQYSKEWIKYSVYPDGTMGEYERNGDYNTPQQGLYYGTINIWQYLLLADALARRGDMELYNYSTSEGLHGTQGGPKSIRLVVEKYCKNITANPAIYYRTVTPNNRIDDYCEPTSTGFAWDVLFSLPNKVWQSSYITSIYTRTAPGINKYPLVGTPISSAASVWFPWGGTGAELPGVLLQYGQLETQVRALATTATVDVPTNLRVPYVLQRSTTLNWDHAIGMLAYNVRYRASTATAWVTVPNVLSTTTLLSTIVPATLYEWQVQAVGSTQTSAWSASSFFSTPASCVGTGSITREQWTNQTGYLIVNTASLPFNKGITPNTTTRLTTLEATNTGVLNYFTRTRGFVCVPTSGTYTFGISGDDDVELWLSPDDDQADAVKIAYTKWTGVREFTKYASQISAGVPLIANQRYYIEVRQLQGAAADHFCVRWTLPNGTVQTPIPTDRIAPYAVNQLPTAVLSSDKTSYSAGNDIVLTSNAIDSDGSVIRVDFYQGSTKIGCSTQAPFSYTYPQVPSGSYTFSAVPVDNTGSSGVATSLTAVVANGPITVANNAPLSACATGTITREFWSGITGEQINLVPMLNPTTTGTLTAFEAPSNLGDNYAQRIRGYICPPVTGAYTFWIASDNRAELWLSTDEDTTHKVRIAYTSLWTNSREYTKYPSQKSVAITLTAGQRYYIEAAHKEGTGGDNLSVQWQLPTGLVETPIPATRLSPWAGLISYTCRSNGAITRDLWSPVTGDITVTNWASTPTTSTTSTSFEAPSNQADTYAQRLAGYICPPMSGLYTFMIAGDNQAELWLSGDEQAANATKIAYTYLPTLAREYTKYATQTFTVWLSANRRYYIEARHREVGGGDHLSVAWVMPNGVSEIPIAGSRLATLASGALRIGVADQAPAATTTSKLTLYPNPATESIYLTANQFAGAEWEVSLVSPIGAVVKTYHPTFADGDRQTEIHFGALNLPVGVYSIQVVDGNKQKHTLRFIKQ